MIKAMTIDPIEPRAHLLLGIVRYKQKRLDEAEEEIRRGLALQRVSTGIIMYHYYLGMFLTPRVTFRAQSASIAWRLGMMVRPILRQSRHRRGWTDRETRSLAGTVR